jgi:hypothetical protein
MRGTNASSPKRRAVVLAPSASDPQFTTRQRARDYYIPRSAVDANTFSRSQQHALPSSSRRRSVDVNPPKRRRLSHSPAALSVARSFTRTSTSASSHRHPSSTTHSTPEERRHDEMILNLHRQRLARDALHPSSSPPSPPSPSPPPPQRAPQQYPRPDRRIQRSRHPASPTSDNSVSDFVEALPVPQYTGPIVSILRSRHVGSDSPQMFNSALNWICHPTLHFLIPLLIPLIHRSCYCHHRHRHRPTRHRMTPRISNRNSY